jgi:hypothetical protein
MLIVELGISSGLILGACFLYYTKKSYIVSEILISAASINNMSELDLTAIKEQIIQWCGDEKLNYEEKKSDKDHFLLFINYPQKSQLKTLVYAPKDKKNVIIVGTSLTISSRRFTEVYQKLGKKKIEEFKYEFYYTFLPVRPNIYLKFNEDNTPERFDVIKKIWLEEKLTKKEFMETLDDTTQCREAARYFCLKYFHLYSDEVARETEETVKEATKDYIR